MGAETRNARDLVLENMVMRTKKYKPQDNQVMMMMMMIVMMMITRPVPWWAEASLREKSSQLEMGLRAIMLRTERWSAVIR